MNRDWKPGDVARVRYGDVDQVGLVRPRKAANNSLEFAYASGGYDFVGTVMARPLAVIDPEDAEQVKRLARIIGVGTWAVADGLREFANPTPSECGCQLTIDVDTGRQGSHDRYVCRKPQGHDGRHQDVQAATSWGES